MKAIEIVGGAIIAFLFWIIVIEEGRVLSGDITAQEESSTVCALQKRSDELTIHCVFDAVGYEQKEACYDKLHEVDKALLQEGLKGNTCHSNFPQMWAERKKK